MKVRLLKDARIRHKKGEIVEVSPDEFKFLALYGAAEPIVEEVFETPEDNKKPTRKKK